ncbi:MAG TPA: hypothetical protein VFT99_13705 [Roseiflexaceae bacterium]|nr:hypothetical protein [Roseiflexaceae bacterium]
MAQTLPVPITLSTLATAAIAVAVVGMVRAAAEAAIDLIERTADLIAQ